MTNPVLIVTGPTAIGGSMTADAGQGLVAAVRRQLGVMRASSSVWLDLGLKAVSAELLSARAFYQRSGAYKNASYRPAVERYFAEQSYFSSPELTEVVLAGLLRDAGIGFIVTTFGELADPVKRDTLLAKTDCVFLSSTLMRDLSEMDPLVRMCKRPHNRVVVGGALASLLHGSWPGHPDVAILAVGYGELLVPVIADWIKSGYSTIKAPKGGRVTTIGGNTVVYSGSPDEKSLDWLPTPDWKYAEEYHGRPFELVHYESVRGCPYRCAFCNYPFLFDDTVFRTKSARRIADDWMLYAAGGAKVVNCLDSLFTIPPKRLKELCEILIAAGSPIRWTCYARAGDLAVPGTAKMMKDAGCTLVHVGYESGSQVILDNMNKKSGVKENVAALKNCREAHLTTAASLVVGFPGETESTLVETVDRLADSPPDLFFAGGFNTRMEKMPVLEAAQRERFGLVTQSDHRSSAPYWRHASLSCDRVPSMLRWLNHTLIEKRVALEGSIFYEGLLGFRHEEREDLLSFQADILKHAGVLRAGGAVAQRVIEAALRFDLRRKLQDAPPQPTQPTPATA
ncbi:MAG: radical SAM protein [Vicinamibacterales bacterium]